MRLNIRLAGQNDLAAVIEFLAVNRLPVAGLVEENVQIYMASVDEELVATIGLEKYGSIGLLRSLAVKETIRKQNLAEKMIRGFFAICEVEDITDVYLLTTTAEQYFVRKGFLKVEREMVPGAVRQTREFRNICPSSAVVMHRQVSEVTRSKFSSCGKKTAIRK